MLDIIAIDLSKFEFDGLCDICNFVKEDTCGPTRDVMLFILREMYENMSHEGKYSPLILDKNVFGALCIILNHLTRSSKIYGPTADLAVTLEYRIRDALHRSE